MAHKEAVDDKRELSKNFSTTRDRHYTNLFEGDQNHTVNIDDDVEVVGKEVWTNDLNSAQTCRLTALHCILLQM